VLSERDVKIKTEVIDPGQSGPPNGRTRPAASSDFPLEKSATWPEIANREDFELCQKILQLLL
jgi:hypothetical protein